MICPCCLSMETRVLNTKRELEAVARRRACQCGARFTSEERVRKGSIAPPLVAMGTPISAGGQPPVMEGTPISGGGISLSDPDLFSDQGSRILSKLNSNSHNKMSRFYSAAFEVAWRAYPRRDEKAMAYAQWQFCAKEMGENELSALVVIALAWQVPLLWAGSNWRFAKYFARYLKARKWEDEPPAAGVVSNGHAPARNYREEATADAFARARAARGGER